MKVSRKILYRLYISIFVAISGFFVAKHLTGRNLEGIHIFILFVFFCFLSWILVFQRHSKGEVTDSDENK